MVRYLSLLFLFASLYGQSQYGSLKVYPELSTEGNVFTLSIETNDKVVLTQIYTGQSDPEFTAMNQLLAGTYQLKIVSNASGELVFSKKFEIVAGKETYMDISLMVSEHKSDTLHRSGKVKERSEGQVSFGYMGKPIEAGAVFPNGLHLGLSGHLWNAFSRHAGFLVGYGFTYRYIQIGGDTSFVKAPPEYREISEAYHYVDVRADAKLRFSAGNQQVSGGPAKWMMELGAAYNFPLYFRYKASYHGGKRISAQWIHQFTDLRAFVNVGYYPFVLFYEHRLSDFVLGAYPELPRSTIGFRLLFGALINDRNP